MRKVTLKSTNTAGTTYSKTFDRIDNSTEVSDAAYQAFANATVALCDDRALKKITVTEYTERDVAIN